MSLSNMICVYDLETSSANPYTTMLLEISAVMVDMKTLKIQEDSEFHALVKHSEEDMLKIEPKALEVNNITLDELRESGLEEKVVFNNFVAYLKKYSKTAKIWDQPYRGGFNIVNFDDIIMNRLCVKYGSVDKEGRPKLFHPFHCFDAMQILVSWTENNPEVTKHNLDFYRDYLGLSKEGAHRATKDTIDTAKIIIRFLQFYRSILSKNKPKIKGSFSE